MPICIESSARSAGKFGCPAIKLCRVHRHNPYLPPTNQPISRQKLATDKCRRVIFNRQLSIAVDGGLSSDSFRARSVPTREESGQQWPLALQKAGNAAGTTRGVGGGIGLRLSNWARNILNQIGYSFAWRQRDDFRAESRPTSDRASAKRIN